MPTPPNPRRTRFALLIAAAYLIAIHALGLVLLVAYWRELLAAVAQLPEAVAMLFWPGVMAVHFLVLFGGGLIYGRLSSEDD